LKHRCQASLQSNCDVTLLGYYFRRKRWAEKEFTLTVWTAIDLEVGPNKIGGNGSHTVVEKLEEPPKPLRKVQRMTGPPEDEALQILRKMEEALAG
jgi:hypothetical protein